MSGESTTQQAPQRLPLNRTEIVFNFVAMRQAESDELLRVAADGSGERQLHQTTYRFHESNGAWSPDGTRLAFEGRTHQDWQAGKPGRDGLYSMTPDGTGRRLLVRGNADDPAWAPDGRRIAFAMGPRGKQAIHVWAENGAVTRLTDFVGATRPTWSPDGSEIAYQHGPAPDATGRALRPSLYMMRSDGSGTRRLGFGGAPDWAPSGEKILFYDCVDCAAPVPVGQSPAWQTFVVELDGMESQKRTRLTDGTATNWLAVWSTDGARIAFVSNRDETGDEIWVMNADGSEPSAVTGRHPDDFRQDSEPDWRPVNAR
jgi:Tol biopolymer transport system component